MADDAFLAQLSAEAADVAAVPTEAGAARLRDMATEMVGLAAEISQLERELKTKNVRLYELKTRDMPSLMAELDVDKFGLASSNCDLVLVTDYHANIKSEWPEEQREAGFAELDRVGGGDIVKDTITIQFNRGQNKLVEAFLATLVSEGYRDELLAEVHERDPSVNDIELPPRERARAVPWNTLTAFVKEQVRRGTVLDLDKLGATVGPVVLIKPRKNT